MNNELLEKNKEEELIKLKKEIIGSKLFIGSVFLFILMILLHFYYRRFIVFVIVLGIVIVGEFISYLYNSKLIKDRVLYLKGIKKIKYEEVKIPIKRLITKCEHENLVVYFKLSDNIHYIETIRNNDIVKYILDFVSFNTLEELLEYKIDSDVKLKDVKSIKLLMYNGSNPIDF